MLTDANPLFPFPRSRYSAATPEYGASILSSFLSTPDSSMRNRLSEPFVSSICPRSRQYSNRCSESILSHEGLPPASREVDVMERQ